MTRESIRAEAAIRRADPSYASASLPWIPAKVYYLLYYQLCTIDYLLDPTTNGTNRDHRQLMNSMTQRLSSGALKFSDLLLNQVSSIEDALTRTQMVAAQLRSNTGDQVLFEMLMKNTAKHLVDQYKTVGKISRKADDRVKLKRWKQNNNISVFHYPFAMRRRTNYKDVDFISGASQSDVALYFDEYLAFGESLDSAFTSLTGELVAART